MAVQIFILEFSKDGSADLGDKFADGGAANQPVVLQGGVCLSISQVSQGYGQFESNFQWLPELVVKKDRWHPDKILVSWDVCVYEVCQGLM